MKQFFLLLLFMMSLFSLSTHASQVNTACADQIMADTDEEEEEEPDCD